MSPNAQPPAACCALIAAAACVVIAVAIGPSAATAQNATKFSVNGDRLVYDTENVTDDVVSSIESQDADELRSVLDSASTITTLHLNSGGGSLAGAQRMADIIIDYGLNTHVDGECESTCTRLLLAGTRRTMSRGSRVGFHQSWWSPPSMERYFESNAAEEGWDTPFEFSSWVYADTQSEIHQQLSFMVARGVEPVFAIETLKTPASDMWYPPRDRLLAAGVLTE